jgi:hypothetical protein
LEFPCAFDEGDFSTEVGVKDGVKGEDLSEKGVEFEVDGLDCEVVICGNTSTGLRG